MKNTVNERNINAIFLLKIINFTETINNSLYFLMLTNYVQRASFLCFFLLLNFVKEIIML